MVIARHDRDGLVWARARQAGSSFDPAELVTIAASAGGIEALSVLLGGLPRAFPAAVAIVLHRRIRAHELLPAVLARETRLDVRLAREGDALAMHTVFIAPADAHLRLGADHRFHLSDGIRIHFVRSSANPLFDSAARVLHQRVIAVVLTGSGSDSTEGVQAVHAFGGAVIAQDPRTARHPSMPRAAIASGAVDLVLPLGEIAPTLVRLVSR